MLRYGALVLLVMLSVLVPAIVFADAHDPKRIMPAEVMEKLTAGEKIVFLDTRTSADWAAGTSMILNAIRVENDDVLTKIARDNPKERLIITYCT